MTIEIRKTEDGCLDEIVAENCTFHMEYMGDRRWWFAVYKGEDQVAVWFSDTKKKPMQVEHEGSFDLKMPR